MSLGALALGVLFYRPIYTYLFLDLLLGGILVALTGSILAIFPSRKAAAAIEDWENKMLPFVYSVNFELLPVTNSNRLIDIWERYKGIYRSFTDLRVPSTGSRFYDSLTLKYNYEVKGKKERHKFDIYAVTEGFLLMVRRIDHDKPVSRDEIYNLKKEVEDVLQRASPSDFRVGVFSRSGFDEDAVTFCKSDEGKIDDGPSADLIRETASGYAVVSFVTLD